MLDVWYMCYLPYGRKLSIKKIKRIFEENQFYDFQLIADICYLANNGPEPYKSKAIELLLSFEKVYFNQYLEHATEYRGKYSPDN